jgi:hypothetical protein
MNMAKERKVEEAESRVTRVRATTTPTAVRNLQTWLRECLFSIVETDDGALRFARIVARQLVKGNRRGEEVFSMEVPKKAGEDWCDLGGMEIWSKLQTETASLGGLQKYALYAYHSGDNEAHTSRFIVRIQGVDEEEEADGLNSESPDKTGLVSQAMRHAEVYAKAMSAMVMNLASSSQAIISRQSAMLEKLMDDKLEGIDAMQAMYDVKEERDIKMIQARAKAKGIENLVSKLGVLLPAVANKISGKPIFPVEDSSMMMMVRSLFTSMATNPERLDKLMGMLSPEEGIAFMNLYEQISAKDIADKENSLVPTDSE